MNRDQQRAESSAVESRIFPWMVAAMMRAIYPERARLETRSPVFDASKVTFCEPSTLTPVDDSAERHRNKRVKHAQTVSAPGGAFDMLSVPLGESITVGERLERLEAAVLTMAAHDPTGPIKSARDFLSLIVTPKLRNVLVRRVKLNRG